jgi:hypothetical protein
VTAPAAARLLTWLTALNGAIAALALGAVVMPTRWMVAGAAWTGVGVFADTTLTQYLVRSTSALYALLGVLMLYLARDVRRHLELLAFIGSLTMALGVILTALDFVIGMPASWSWGEGPPTILVGGAFVWLARRARQDPRGAER